VSTEQLHIVFVQVLPAPHAEVSDAVHWTQVPVVVSQAGVSPVHAEASDAVHWTQVPAVVLQTGASAKPLQSAF
jgi:hypothetical protein